MRTLTCAATLCACSMADAQTDMRFFTGTWEFRIWGSADISGPPAFTGSWHVEDGLDSALALIGRVELNDGPDVQGGTFTRELIAYDPHTRMYTRSIVSNNGSTYHFTSSGWQGDRLVWTGSQHGTGGRVELREEIERTGPDHFTAIFHRKDGDTWVLQSSERLQRASPPTAR